MEGLSKEQFEALTTEVGMQATAAIQKELTAYEVKVKEFATQIVNQKGGITLEQFEAYKLSAETAFGEVKKIAEKQGTEMATIVATLGGGRAATKSISQVFEEDKEVLRKIFDNGMGQKTYMIQINEKGQPIMKPFSMTEKVVGVEASIANVPSGAVASITQALDAATLLRVGNGAQIYGQFRNTPWVFDLCNTINASFNTNMPYAIWFDEQDKVGGSTTVLEGATKPGTQYRYELKSAQYKKEATIVGFTQEFQMDFPQLESDIMNKARIDVINRVNSAILPNIIAAATFYNTELSFRGGTGVAHQIPLVNDFDAIAAMAAQVDNATFGSALANAAIMSTFKKYRMGITKSTQGEYLNPPAVLDGISFVGNPAMAADDIIVGDLKQYNIILRGGLIVRVGYNGTNFAENKYSVVLEQFYYDYISTIRKVAIVKGLTFQNVKNTLTDDQGSI